LGLKKKSVFGEVLRSGRPHQAQTHRHSASPGAARSPGGAGRVPPAPPAAGAGSSAHARLRRPRPGTQRTRSLMLSLRGGGVRHPIRFGALSIHLSANPLHSSLIPSNPPCPPPPRTPARPGRPPRTWFTSAALIPCGNQRRVVGRPAQGPGPVHAQKIYTRKERARVRREKRGRQRARK